MNGFQSGPVALRDAALFTDLYQLTMAASYWREAMAGRATAFEHCRLKGRGMNLSTLARSLGSA